MTEFARKKDSHGALKVLLAGSNEQAFQKTAASLADSSEIIIIGQGKDKQEIVELLEYTQPQVVLLNITTLCVRNLKSILEVIQTLSHQAKIIVLHNADQKALILEAFRQGVAGHLALEETSPEELLAAIRTVLSGEVILSPSIAGSILDEIVLKQHSKPNR